MASHWFQKWFGRWSNFDSATSLVGYLWQAFLAITGLTGAGMIAWGMSTLDWYWAMFNWAGVGIAFLVAWLVLSLGFFLIAHGVRAWRRDLAPTNQFSLKHETASSSLIDPNVGQEPRYCDFLPYEFRTVHLDPGENYGGNQLFYQLIKPIVFKINANNVTILVTAIREKRNNDRLPAQYSWREVESASFFAGERVEILFASLAVNRSNHGYYGNLRGDAFYLFSTSRHIFEFGVFIGDKQEADRLYLECSPQQALADPPEGLGRLHGIVVLDQSEDVFARPWIAESRGSIQNVERNSSADAAPGLGPLGSRPLGS